MLLSLLRSILPCVALVACTDSIVSEPMPQERNAGPTILAAYHGLDELPAAVSLICSPDAVGVAGMPVVFSVQLALETVSAAAFLVETGDGRVVSPRCATLAPAVEPLERRTVLLAGDFGTADSSPRAVEVVANLMDVTGKPLVGLRTEEVTTLEEGPTLVLAERFNPDTPGLVGECPEETAQVVQLTWAGGVHGAGHLPLAEPQWQGTTVTLADGRQVHPIAMADDDPDNHVHACLDADSPAQLVTVDPGLFEDPGGDLNPETTIQVQQGLVPEPAP